jgi:hypothetical protein
VCLLSSVESGEPSAGVVAVKRRNILLKLAVVGNSVLLVSLLVCYRAGAFNWLTAPGTPPVDLSNSDAPESNVSASKTSENVAGNPKEARDERPYTVNLWIEDPKNPEAPPSSAPEVTLFSMNSTKSGPVFPPWSPPPGATRQPPATAKRSMLPGSKSAEVFDPPTSPPKGP